MSKRSSEKNKNVLFAGKIGAKRLSKGIWKCSRKKCDKKFASNTYYLE